MIRRILFRSLVMLIMLIVVCEAGLRIRLAYLYKNPSWLFYHQFKLRTVSQIDADMPYYYKDNMFKPFRLVFRQEPSKKKKEIITIESSALRSIRRQLQKIVDGDGYNFTWLDYSPNKNKEIEFTNNNIVLYEFLVYPDIYNTLKRDSRVLEKILGKTIDDFLYHNLAFYMHIDENINFTTMNSDGMIKAYIGLLSSREEPFCKDVRDNGYRNIFYVITPNKFDPQSSGGRVYLRYVQAAHRVIIDMLNKYNVPYVDLMDKNMPDEDFKDYFHLSPAGGRKLSYEILNYLTGRGF